LSNTDNYYYTTIPEGHISQGAFSFGLACSRAQSKVTENHQCEPV